MVRGDGVLEGVDRTIGVEQVSFCEPIRRPMSPWAKGRPRPGQLWFVLFSLESDYPRNRVTSQPGGGILSLDRQRFVSMVP